MSSAYENSAISSRLELLIVLELLHLKMEVTVSEPCDVIRVIIHIVQSYYQPSGNVYVILPKFKMATTNRPF